MAISGSGLYVATIMDAFDTTQLALDLDLDTHKGALFSNSITPNYLTDTAWGVAPYNANEVTGTNWSSGGVVLTGTNLASSAGGILTYDATDVSVASTTISGARGYLLYADALAGNNAILLVDFGADYATSNGTFAIVWNASGIFTIDLVP
jgi:hypothetical protein